MIQTYVVPGDDTKELELLTGFGNLRTANWRTGNMRTNMRTRPLIGRDVTRVPRAVRKVPHWVRSSHCFVSRPNQACQFIAEIFFPKYADLSSLKYAQKISGKYPENMRNMLRSHVRYKLACLIYRKLY